MSTNSTPTPNGAKYSRSTTPVPKYVSAAATTCALAPNARNTAVVAACPDANAAASTPPSSAASARSSSPRVGFVVRA